MNPIKAILIGILGLLGLGYVLLSLARGAVDLGGKRGGSFVVAFADSPGLFLIGVLLIAVLSAGMLVLAWRALTGKDDS